MTTSRRLIADVLVIVLAVAAFLYFIIDDTPATWLVRAAWAGALTAGLGIALYALASLADRQ